MRRTGITSDGEDGAAPTAAGPSNVIPFRRASAAHFGSAAGDDPLSSPAIPLGILAQAVVMKLANEWIRLRVARAGSEEEEESRREL